jgi:hypothetical protein
VSDAIEEFLRPQRRITNARLGNRQNQHWNFTKLHGLCCYDPRIRREQLAHVEGVFGRSTESQLAVAPTCGKSQEPAPLKTQCIECCALSDAEQEDSFLLTLDRTDRHRPRIVVSGYPKRMIDKANADYLEAKKKNQGSTFINTVLVAVERIDELKKAYPNYFLDLGAFVSILQEVF